MAATAFASSQAHNVGMSSRTSTPRRAAVAPIDPLAQPTPLLGGLSPQAFMRRHWQKKPLLIRQAVPGVQPPVSRAELFALAAQDDVESRLIVRQPGQRGAKGKALAAQAPDWRLKRGPVARRSLPPLSQPGWTVLVQGLDLHVPAAHELLQRFRFVPDARLDDLMISYATDTGGVGPHYDSYDVFLLQVSGRRRWRIAPLKDRTLEPDVPLKILRHFTPTEEWVLEAGDMLYLPPGWAHDGAAEGDDCMTCSVGFRVPEATGLSRELLLRWADELEPPERPRLYRDPAQPATATPARIPDGLQTFAQEAISRLLIDPQGLMSALGEVLTEPKPSVWFQGGSALADGDGVRLDPKTRMMYDDARVFANGESWRAAGKDARVLQTLADQRQLTPLAVSRASPAVRELLTQWALDGWLHPWR